MKKMLLSLALFLVILPCLKAQTYLPLSGGTMSGNIFFGASTYQIQAPYYGINYGSAQPSTSNNVSIFANNNTTTMDFTGWSNGWRFVPTNASSYPAPVMSLSQTGNMNLAGALALGSGSVNLNTTKLFLNNPAGKKWAISSGLNNVNEPYFGIYNWTDRGQASVPAASFCISDGGNVGIGTMNPGTSKLNVGPQGAGSILIGNSNTSNGGYTSLLMGITALSGGNAYIQGTTSSGTNYGTMTLNPFGGNVGIGTSTTGNYKLAVEGWLGARKVVVTQAPWADYVFEPGYELRPLREVERFVKDNRHLPEVPTTAEIEKSGVDVGDTQTLLLKKIEELTLYLIEQNKKIEALTKEMESFKKAQH